MRFPCTACPFASVKRCPSHVPACVTDKIGPCFAVLNRKEEEERHAEPAI